MEISLTEKEVFTDLRITAINSIAAGLIAFVLLWTIQLFISMLAATTFEFRGIIYFDAFIIYFASICWTVGYDTIYAYQDRNDDIKYNIKSSAVQLGEFGPSFIWSAYKLCIVTLCIAGLNAHMNLCFYLISAIASYSLYRQIENLDIHNPKNCQAIMNKNIEFGFWVLLAIFVGRI